MLDKWPAPERNKEPILAQLRPRLRPGARVLEIASGSGQHAVHVAAALPQIRWHPTDLDPSNLASVAAWIEHTGLPNVAPPRRLDVLEDWGVEPASFDAVFCANMIHISPPTTWPALLSGAARVLVPGGFVGLYGPFFVGGESAPSNFAFDASLKSRDRSWGVRELDDLRAYADELPLSVEAPVQMPANNLFVVFERPR